jgi:hypothetical protein
MAKVLVIMNRAFGYIFFVAVVILTGGCKEPQTRSAQIPLEGIKLADLEPTTGTFGELGPQINFRVYIFEIPAERLSSPKELFLGLLRKPLHFANRTAFEANGFFVGFGRNEMWDEIAGRLQQLGARNAGTSLLIVFDDKGDDIILKAVDTERPIFYTNSAGKLAGVTLGDGRCALRIKAKPATGRRGTAEVDIQPIFKRSVDTSIARLLGTESKEEIVFDFAGFDLTMSRGDFVLVGPSRYEEDEISLSNLFFAARRDFAFAVPKQNEKGQEAPGQPRYTLGKNVPLIRLCLIACTGVGD